MVVPSRSSGPLAVTFTSAIGAPAASVTDTVSTAVAVDGAAGRGRGAAGAGCAGAGAGVCADLRRRVRARWSRRRAVSYRHPIHDAWIRPALRALELTDSAGPGAPLVCLHLAWSRWCGAVADGPHLWHGRHGCARHTRPSPGSAQLLTPGGAETSSARDGRRASASAAGTRVASPPTRSADACTNRGAAALFRRGGCRRGIRDEAQHDDYDSLDTLVHRLRPDGDGTVGIRAGRDRRQWALHQRVALRRRPGAGAGRGTRPADRRRALRPGGLAHRRSSHRPGGGHAAVRPTARDRPGRPRVFVRYPGSSFSAISVVDVTGASTPFTLVGGLQAPTATRRTRPAPTACSSTSPTRCSPDRTTAIRN